MDLEGAEGWMARKWISEMGMVFLGVSWWQGGW